MTKAAHTLRASTLRIILKPRQARKGYNWTMEWMKDLSSFFLFEKWSLSSRRIRPLQWLRAQLRRLLMRKTKLVSLLSWLLLFSCRSSALINYRLDCHSLLIRCSFFSRLCPCQTPKNGSGFPRSKREKGGSPKIMEPLLLTNWLVRYSATFFLFVDSIMVDVAAKLPQNYTNLLRHWMASLICSPFSSCPSLESSFRLFSSVAIELKCIFIVSIITKLYYCLL